MGLTWWVVWYQFALLVVIAVAAVAGKLHKLAMILLSLLASLLALLMLETHEAGRLFRSSDGAVCDVLSLYSSDSHHALIPQSAIQGLRLLFSLSILKYLKSVTL